MGPRLLADLGADVIKLETPHGDPLRVTGGAFLGWNRNKRGMVADLRTPEGREIAYRLVDRADVLCQNWRPGVAEAIGFDYPRLAARNPRLVYVSVTGFGPSGPYVQKPGWDPLIQARAGMMRDQGGPAHPPVYLYGSPTDYWAAQLGATGVCAALLAREGTGRGQHIESSLLKGGLWGIADRFLDYAGMPPPYENDPDHVGPSPTYRLYETRDGWLFLAAVKPAHKAALASVLRASSKVNVQSSKRVILGTLNLELGTSLEAAFRTRTAADWLADLRGAGVPAAPISIDFKDAFFSDPHAQARGFAVHYEHPEFGGVDQTGPLTHVGGHPPQPGPVAPQLGQHTRAILAELGYTPSQIADLARRRIIICAGETY
jgi:crotonobetainyl-CoA:carnitine CoA-transferase CaiB-like acyl-CoA transferase